MRVLSILPQVDNLWTLANSWFPLLLDQSCSEPERNCTCWSVIYCCKRLLCRQIVVNWIFPKAWPKTLLTLQSWTLLLLQRNNTIFKKMRKEESKTVQAQKLRNGTENRQPASHALKLFSLNLTKDDIFKALLSKMCNIYRYPVKYLSYLKRIAASFENFTLYLFSSMILLQGLQHWKHKYIYIPCGRRPIFILFLDLTFLTRNTGSYNKKVYSPNYKHTNLYHPILPFTWRIHEHCCNIRTLEVIK